MKSNFRQSVFITGAVRCSLPLFSVTFLTVLLSLSLTSCNRSTAVQHRENGWYLITDEGADSLATVPIATVKDFIALELDSDASGTYVISGKISGHKQGAWADATEQAVGQRIGFVFNDTVITAPQINTRIESGHFQISNPYGYDLKNIYRQLVAEKRDSIEALFKGWDKDSTYYHFTPRQIDSIMIGMDYWDARAVAQGLANR